MLQKNTKSVWSNETLCFIFLFLFYNAYAQEFPPIERFTPQDYKADDQNWSISQDSNKNIYVANNKGLLEYNGARWNLYSINNQSIIRSVAVINDLVYSGSYMDFGYWKRNSFGEMIYKSISKELNGNLVDDVEFWNIIPYDDFVLFQSLDRIYIYNTLNKTFRIINSKTNIIKAFRVGEVIYFQESGLGISKIENGKAVLICEDKLVKEEDIINIFTKDNNLIIHFRDIGFYNFDGKKLSRLNMTSNALLSKVSSYSSTRLRNGNFILGTISNGVIILDSNGNVIYQINKNSGLSNNTVLSVFQDVSGNTWLALDNGINVLNLDSPYRVYTDKQGYLGTVYASESTSKNLYLGTNQGLFYRPINSFEKFKLIPKTKGQVWFLKEINGTLFCGHNNGTFEVKDDVAYKISNQEGNWIIRSVENKPNLLVIGNYNGLSVIEKSSAGFWKFRNKVEGFDISSRYFEFINDSELLVSHEYKGVYKLKLENDLSQVISYDKLEVDKGIGSSLINYKGKILYSYDDGLFSYDDKNEVFRKTDLLKAYFTASNYISGKLVYDENKDRLWSFSKNQLIYLETGKLTDKPKINTIDLPSDLRKSKPGFENILYLDNNSYLLGTTDGYLIIDVEKFKVKEYVISIDSASYLIQQQEVQPIDISSSPFLKNQQNDLYFTFSVSDLDKFSPSFYQYRLVGVYDYWSEWTIKSNVLYENLPHGDYTFEVRGKVGSNISNTGTFNFTIDKPWHLKPLAIASYIFLFVIIAAIIQYLNRMYYKRQKDSLLKTKEKELEIKELENQRQLMEYKNKSLQQNIENKNRELGISTMTLIRKNEFLSSLKKELSAIDKLNELNRVTKIIDKNINNKEDWKFFQDAFNNADKDFLKKIKNLHPILTPNDLKLCAYLRLNLSSKEIAPLLNISHRSVEVKRYRLRKKMKLSRQASLANYILEI